MDTLPRRDRLLLLAVLGTGVFLAGLELMITAVALPAIVIDLADWTRLREASWIINGYLLVYVVTRRRDRFAGLCQSVGRWGDAGDDHRRTGFDRLAEASKPIASTRLERARPRIHMNLLSPTLGPATLCPSACHFFNILSDIVMPPQGTA